MHVIYCDLAPGGGVFPRGNMWKRRHKPTADICRPQGATQRIANASSWQAAMQLARSLGDEGLSQAEGQEETLCGKVRSKKHCRILQDYINL